MQHCIDCHVWVVVNTPMVGLHADDKPVTIWAALM